MALKRKKRFNCIYIAKAYSEPFQRNMMERFCENSSITEDERAPRYTSASCKLLKDSLYQDK